VQLGSNLHGIEKLSLISFGSWDRQKFVPGTANFLVWTRRRKRMVCAGGSQYIELASRTSHTLPTACSTRLEINSTVNFLAVHITYCNSTVYSMHSTAYGKFEWQWPAIDSTVDFASLRTFRRKRMVCLVYVLWTTRTNHTLPMKTTTIKKCITFIIKVNSSYGCAQSVALPTQKSQKHLFKFGALYGHPLFILPN
jgi:hypothetical protein